MAVTDEGVAQRARILDAALALMGGQGVGPTSMRQLADACEVNVATLYHYFGSKADLLAAVIDERGYSQDLAQTTTPVSRDGSPAERLARLVTFIGEAVAAEEVVWRLLVGEAVHREPMTTATANELAAGLEDALRRWLPDLVPEIDVDALVRVVRTHVLGLLVDLLISPPADATAIVARNAEDLSVVVFRDGERRDVRATDARNTHAAPDVPERTAARRHRVPRRPSGGT